MGELSLGEAELCLEVSGQVGGGLNGGEDAGVDGLLIFLALSGGLNGKVNYVTYNCDTNTTFIIQIPRNLFQNIIVRLDVF